MRNDPQNQTGQKKQSPGSQQEQERSRTQQAGQGQKSGQQASQQGSQKGTQSGSGRQNIDDEDLDRER